MTGGARGLSGMQQHADSAGGEARAEIEASDARAKLLHANGLKWARGSCRCNSLHRLGKKDVNDTLLETKRRNVPDGSESWSWNAQAGYTTDVCTCCWRNSRTQGNRHTGEDLDHSRIHEVRLPAREQHSANKDQSLQKLDHM